MNHLKNICILLGFCLLIVSCGSDSIPIIENTYFGKYPSMAKAFQLEDKQKQAEITLATKEMEENFKVDYDAIKDMSMTEVEEFALKNPYAKKVNDLETAHKSWRKETYVAIEEYVKTSTLLNREIPFEMEGNDFFEVNNVIIKDFYERNGRIALNLLVKYKDDVKKQRYIPHLYVKCIDSNGNTISKTAASAPISTIIGGQQAKVGCTLSGELQENFAKLIQITKEEYESKE